MRVVNGVCVCVCKCVLCVRVCCVCVCVCVGGVGGGYSETHDTGKNQDFVEKK